MKRLFYMILVLLFTISAGYCISKADTNPALSGDGRYVTFERHYDGKDFVEIVVVDTRSMIAKTVVGPAYDIAWKDKLTFAIAGCNHVSILKPNGWVLHSAWRTGPGFRAVPREWESVGSLKWKDKGVTFTAVEEGGRTQAWFMDQVSGKIDLLENVDPVPLRYRKSAELGSERIEVASSGALVHRGPGHDDVIRLGSAEDPQFSPSGNEIVVVDNRGQRPLRNSGESKNIGPIRKIYILNREGYALRPLADSGGSRPAFHPTGKGIAYVTPAGDVAWASIDGSDQHILVRKPESVSQLRWHSDGNWLLVQSVSNGQASWMMLNPPSRRLKPFGVPLNIPKSGKVFLSPTGRMAVVLRQGSSSGEVDLVGRRKTRTIRFEFPQGQSLGYAPSAGWSADEQYVAVSMGGGISIIDMDEGTVEPVTGRLY